MPGRILEVPRSISLAADVEPEKFEGLVEQLHGVEGLTTVKIGFEVGLGLGLRTAVKIVHEAGLKAVYDHQKAANDIPATGMNFARAMERAQVDAAILFPYTGPVTQEAWTNRLQEAGVGVISGGEMTHDEITASEDGLTAGYVHPRAFARMYARAAELGVRDFVVPGNKPAKVSGYRSQLEQLLGVGNFTLWAPGFVTQGGDISETGRAAGPSFNAIVGSGIYGTEVPREAAIALGQAVLGEAA